MLKKLLAAAVVAATMTAAHAEVKTIKDVLGREVKVDVPAKRIMLGFYYTDYLAVGGEKALDNVSPMWAKLKSAPSRWKKCWR